MKAVVFFVALGAATWLPEVISQGFFYKRDVIQAGKRVTRQTSADQMVQNILQWLQGVYAQNSRKIRQGSLREYLPPSHTQKPRPFGPPSQESHPPQTPEDENNIIGYPPAASITPQPPFPFVTSPVTGGVTGEGYPSQNSEVIPPKGLGYPPAGEAPQPPFSLPSAPGAPPESNETYPAPKKTSTPSVLYPTPLSGYSTQPPEQPGPYPKPEEPSTYTSDGPETYPSPQTEAAPYPGPSVKTQESTPETEKPSPYPGPEELVPSPETEKPVPYLAPETEKSTPYPSIQTEEPVPIPDTEKSLPYPGSQTEEPGYVPETEKSVPYPEPQTELTPYRTQQTEVPGPGPETEKPAPYPAPESEGVGPIPQTQEPGLYPGPSAQTEESVPYPGVQTEKPAPYPETEEPAPYPGPLPQTEEPTPYPGPRPHTEEPVPGIISEQETTPRGSLSTFPPLIRIPTTSLPEVPSPITEGTEQPSSTEGPGIGEGTNSPIESLPSAVPSDESTTSEGPTLEESGTTSLPKLTAEDLAHPPHIHAIDVECAKDMMTINIEFNRQFDGVIYSKGFYSRPECRYVSEDSGQTKYSFTVSLNSCGTEFINAFDTQGQSYLENVLVLQNEPGIQEVWDTIRSVRCLWERNLSKSLTVSLSVGMLTQEIVTFSGDTAMAMLDIQLGKGPFAPTANGLVKIGEPMTLVVSVTGDPYFDIYVRECKAKDDTGDNEIPLTDQNGCVLKPKLIGSFQKTKDTGNTGASIIAYAFFNAFKFPDMMDLMIECEIDLCKTECEMCPDPNQKIEPGRRRRRDLNQTLSEPMKVGKMLRVLVPSDLSDGETIVNVRDAEKLCLPLQGFVVFIALLISLLTATSLFSAYMWLQNRRFKIKKLEQLSQ